VVVNMGGIGVEIGCSEVVEVVEVAEECGEAIQGGPILLVAVTVGCDIAIVGVARCAQL
jgi:hypothetical protein